MRIVELDRVAPLPWRNGRGHTRELHTWPPDAGPDGWRLRISVADIDTDASFSTFPGVERWFAVLEGAGVALDIDGTTKQLGADDAPLRFAGEAAVQARLVAGPTRDLNLMLRRDDGDGRMVRLRAAARWSPMHAQCGLYAATPLRCEAGDATLDLPARSLLWFDVAPAALALRALDAGGRIDALGLGYTPRRQHP
jgi:environmental stress-induced protein Ves